MATFGNTKSLMFGKMLSLFLFLLPVNPATCNPQDPALASEENTGHQYQPLLLILSLRGIELYFLTQVSSEIRRDRQTPEGAGKLQTSQGSRHSKWGTEEDAENQRKTTMSAGSGAEDQNSCMYSVTSNLLLSLNEPSSLFYLINWTVRKRREKNL